MHAVVLNGRNAARVALALVAALAASSVGAQTWTFEQLAELARAGHPSVLAKQSSAAAAKADVEGAEWQRYPTPSVQAGHDSHTSQATSVFRLQQPLWAGGRITAGIDAAQARHGASEKSVLEARQDVVQKVINAFVEAQRGQTRQESMAKSVRQHERLLELIDRRVKAEASPAVDRQLAQSRLYQTMNELSASTQALNNATTQLSQLAGRPVTKVLPLAAPQTGMPGSRDEAFAQADDASPALARLALEEEAAGADIDSKRAAYWPQVALRYERNHEQFDANNRILPAFNRVMVVMETQFGAGLSAGAGVAAAVAKRQAVRDERIAATRDLHERVAVQWNEWVAARLRHDNARLASDDSNAVFESYTRQYTTGRKSWLDVLNAVREANQAELAVADAQAQAVGAAMRLQLLAGTLPVMADAPVADSQTAAK